MVGPSLSRYKILEKIGEGGMGVVYKAQDTRLDRVVALKVLPSPLNLDEKRRRRFLHEARAASALNHPNICQIHDIAREKGVDFIVMEYVRGKTLRELIDASGGLPEHKVIRIGVEICSALQAAHEKGIIHRDIKPDNIMITEQGGVKVTDFGLAKLKGDVTHVGHPAPDAGRRLSAATSASTLVGTVFYMSPEQIEKREIDERTDLFSLGVVLYEMVTGQRPFGGADNLTVMESILEDEPLPPSSITRVSEELEKLILTAMAKEPQERFQSAGEIGEKLRDLGIKEREGHLRRYPRQKRSFILAFLVLLTLAGFLWYSRGRGQKVRLFPVLNSAALERYPVLSPRGDKILFWYGIPGKRFSSGFFGIYNLRDSTERLIQGWGIPDDWLGDKILYRSYPAGLCVADSSFSPRDTLADFGANARFSPDGERVAFCSTASGYIGEPNGIYVVDLASGERHRVSPDNGLFYSDPVWSPDGRYLLCVAGGGSVYELWVIQPETKRSRQISDFGCWLKSPVVSESRSKVYFLSDKNGGFDVWCAPMDFRTGRLTGRPSQLTFGLDAERMDIGAEGNRLVLDTYRKYSTISKAVFVGPEDQNFRTVSIPGIYHGLESIRLSPDRSQLLIEARRKGERCIILRSLTDGSERIVATEAKPFAPSWSPDGRWIVFDAGGGDNADIWRTPVGGGSPEILIRGPRADWMPTYSPDGSKLCFVSNRLDNQFDLWVKDFSDNREYRITNTPEYESRGFWSHNGRFVAYISIEQGRTRADICVYDFATGRSTRISRLGYRFCNVLNALAWKEDDSAIYLIEPTAGASNLFREIRLDGGGSRVIGKFRAEEVTPAAFDVDHDTLYLASYSVDADIWMLELE